MFCPLEISIHKMRFLLLNLCLMICSCYSLYSTDLLSDRKLLSEALQQKNNILMHSLIESGHIAIDEISENGRTPLMEAAYYGYQDAVNYLIEQGADVNFKTSTETPLTCAIDNYWRKGDFLTCAIITALIKAGAEFNERPSSWRPTPFMRACAENAVNCVQAFIDAGVDLEIATSDGKTALMYAMESGKTGVLPILIENGASLDARDAAGKTALFYAIEKKSFLLSNQLIQAGANVNIRDSNGTTPFMYAVSKGLPDLSELLWKHTNDIKTINYQNQTALSFVAGTNDLKTAQRLIQAGLKLEQVDEQGFTPLLSAIQQNKTQMAMFFIEQGADVSVVAYKRGFSAIYLSVKNKNFVLTHYLFEKHAPIDLPDSFGFTPLMQAIINDDYEHTAFLLAKGANRDAKTHSAGILTVYPSRMEYSIPSQTTVLDLAKLLDRSSLIELLSL